MAELCLGTVQFGMKYGINNTLGQPSEENVFEMLDTAFENGIRVIDTARAYGTAETVLGRYFASGKNVYTVKIISKPILLMRMRRTFAVQSGESVKKHWTDFMRSN